MVHLNKIYHVFVLLRPGSTNMCLTMLCHFPDSIVNARIVYADGVVDAWPAISKTVLYDRLRDLEDDLIEVLRIQISCMCVSPT